MDALQDDEVARSLLAAQARLENMRAPKEALWREIDERVNVLAGGGFDGSAAAAGLPGGGAFRLRGQYNFDATAIEGLDRFVGALAGITIPRNQVWHSLTVADKDLAKLPAVRRWCEAANDRLYAIRYNPHAGFAMQAQADLRQIGAYGTAPFWISDWRGQGLFYRAIHLSEIYIDEDFRGRVDTVHRRFRRSVRQLQQQYGEEALTPKMRDKVRDGKLDEQFEMLTVYRPNMQVDQDKFDWRGKPIESIHVAIDEKWIVRRSGFHSMPLPVSRDVLGAGDVYGRSPAMKVFGTILGANQMGRTNLRAAHKAVDPALAFSNEDGLSAIVTKPGGLNPGLVDPDGRVRVARLPGGEAGLPVAMEMLEGERQVIKTAFLEEFFKILTDPSDRMTATQVLEMVAKQGVLVAPFADRHETEKMSLIIDRELDLCLRAGQIEPMPPEMLEAGAWPRVEYQNPLAKMARAQEASGLTRLVETLAPIAQVDPHVFDVIDTDAAAAGVADVLGVRPSWIRGPDEIAAIRAKRSEAEAAQQGVEQLATAAGAYKDLAAGNAQAAAA